jgi:aminopeptidase
MNLHSPAALPDSRQDADHLARLDRLAEVAVRVGLGLKPGQELIMTAPVEALPLARRITEHAYRAGASLVTTLYADDQATLMRYRFAPEESFDAATGWLFEGMAKAFEEGAARLAVVGDDPSLLSGQDPARVSRANRARSRAYVPALELIASFATNWTIVSYATTPWAKAMFPDEPEAAAVARLWDAIFAASRVDAPDPVAAWDAHNAALRARTDLLNARAYAALHFRGPGTDLTVGLADDHEWAGGATTAKNGIVCNANIPTEEVFTTPHKDRVDGEVTSTKPLSYQGTLIEGIRVRFEGGRIVEASATSGGGRAAPGPGDRRGREPPRRGGARTLLLADLAERAALPQHPLRRERREPHRAGPSLQQVLPERGRGPVRGRPRGARREPQPDPHRLDDRLGPGGRGRRRPDGTREPLMRGGEWVTG